MAEILRDDPETIEMVRSAARLLEQMRPMALPERRRFWNSLADCSDEAQQVVARMLSVIDDAHSAPAERRRALMAIANALFSNPAQEGERAHDLAATESIAGFPRAPSEVLETSTQEALFAGKLRELMEAKRVTQQELADRIGCTQPAISQLLNRNCRPQKNTILKLAEALNVQPRDLWPDLEVAELLDAVASFEQEEYTMTEADSDALGHAAKRNPPKISARSLPVRHRRKDDG